MRIISGSLKGRKIMAPGNLPVRPTTDVSKEALFNIHFPKSAAILAKAKFRLIFEELFIAQIRLNLIKIDRHKNSKGQVFEKVGDYFNTFYNNYLPFELTGAQKRVIKEIRQDVAKGFQMNRLLQGDVGSGKTMIALMAMLIAADNGFQSCLMAPTEILANQHFNGITELAKNLNINIRKKIFRSEEYTALKDFFNQIITIQRQYIVLEKRNN